MAIKTFKDIEQKKGYRVEKKDREIFEREVRRGIFGIDSGDIIEFVLYDASDNPLPQEAANGKTVRYIYYTDENIQKYFSKVNKTKYNIKRNGAEEFFVDVEKLIKEAGYSQGIFKTSISLLNRRLGSEERKFDKAWIHEISPSRTEVRVLPVIDESTGKPNSDLQTRYNTFTSGEDFSADVLLFLDEFSGQFDVTKVLQKMLSLRGKTDDGLGYTKLIEKEFKIDNFEKWLSLVKISFDKSLDHYRNNRYSNILEQSKFGKPTGESFGINFSSKGIVEQLCDIAENCVNYHLPNQDIRTETSRSRKQQETLDKVKQILKTVSSDGEFLAEEPTAKTPAIRGCRDPKAKNYNPAATVDDVCEYEVTVTKYKKVPVPPPPPPPPPPPAPAPSPSPSPRPRPSGGSSPKPAASYSVSAELVQASPAPPNGRIIQEIRVTVTPKPKSGYKASISSASDWMSITIPERNINNGTALLRVKIPKNTTGAPKLGSIDITTTLPGSPGASVPIGQELGGSISIPVSPKPVPVTPSPKPAPTPTPPKGGGSSGGCLVGNTMIELSSGQFIPIKDVKVGDSLKGLDILTLSSWNEVEDNWKGTNIQKYLEADYKVINTMTIGDAEVYSINDGLLECSEDHKHLVRRGEDWMIRTTLQLEPGDIYLDRDRNEIMIQNISWDRVEDVYLITLDGKHTYYANGILTHNRKVLEVIPEAGGFRTGSLYDTQYVTMQKTK